MRKESTVWFSTEVCERSHLGCWFARDTMVQVEFKSRKGMDEGRCEDTGRM